MKENFADVSLLLIVLVVTAVATFFTISYYASMCLGRLTDIAKSMQESKYLLEAIERRLIDIWKQQRGRD
jgi:hypothetical protein